MSNHVIFRQVNRIGEIILNRPQKLNVLSTDMICQMHHQLNDWVYSESESDLQSVESKKIDPKIDLMFIDANYQNQRARAFCAGGDVQAMTCSGIGNQIGKDFACHYYQFTSKLAELFPKTQVPAICFLDGIVMGGGVGLTIYTPYRIVTENTKFAMPENSLGWFPDVGKSYFMNHIIDSENKFENLAKYLALTGSVVSGIDTRKIDLGTHFIRSKDLGVVKQLIFENSEKLDQILSEFCENDWLLEPSPLETVKDEIKLSFAGESVEQIIKNLESLDSDFGRQTIARIRQLNPTSLEVALQQLKLRECKNFQLQDALHLEYSLSCQFLDEPNFYEGVRAKLVDKTGDPAWSETPEDVNRYFLDQKYRLQSVSW